MKTSVALCILTILTTIAAAGAEPAATEVVDPYGIIIKPIPDKTVVLTFDDACRSHATFVAPLLKEYGFGGSFYITTAFGFKTRKDWYMTWEQIKAMHDMGFEIGNHTFNHQSSTAVLPRQYIRSVEVLEQDFEKHGIPPSTTFCYPMSRVNPNVHSFLRENGYLLARGGSPFDSRTRRPYDPLRDSPLHVPAFAISDGQLKKQPDLFSSLAKQARNGKIVVFTFHGVPDEEHPGVGTGQEKFKELMEYLKKNRYNVIALRDVAEYVDVTKAALCLSRSTQYPWGGSSLLTGARVNRKGSTLYIGIEELPADRKLTLLNMTTKIERAWFLADPKKNAIPVETASNGISTITVPPFSPDRYGESPVIIAAELQGGPVATILDFAFPGLPKVTFSGNEIRAVVPEAADLRSLAPVYKTGSELVTGKPASGEAVDFTRPQSYTITAADGTSRTYSVTVTRKANVAGVANPSFEIFDSLNKESSGIAPKGALWKFTQGFKTDPVGIVSVGSHVLYRLDYGRVKRWCYAPPDGSRHCAIISGHGSSISQTVVFDEGDYTISFDRLLNGSKPAPGLRLMLDGRVLLALEGTPVKEPSWKRHTSPVFTVTAGPHEIEFSHDDHGERGPHNLIDNLTINQMKKQ